MEKTIKTMFAMLVVVCVAITAFTACSDDDSAVTEVEYYMGFPKISGDGADFVQETTAIESCFKKALGVTDSSFTKIGDVETCDKEVREACQNAFNALKGTQWKGSYIFQVLNDTTREQICEIIFKANDENFI